MELENFIEQFKICKIKGLDIAFINTKEKLGFNHTKMALKYIFFNIKDELNDIDYSVDKYCYISSKNGGREFIKLIDIFDVYQIICRYVLEMVAISDLNFTKIEKNNHKNIVDYKIIEFLATMLVKDIDEAYQYLKVDDEKLVILFDSLLDSRYKLNKIDDLDSAYQKMSKSILEVYESLGDYFDKRREES